MQISPTEAADILSQIRENQLKWLKVKRFVPQAYSTSEDRYAALEQHHAGETGGMIEIIIGLCETTETLAKTQTAKDCK
jgi:hypothetical protein